ncbi:protein LTV1 homolog [Mizuhopecten yessoensis]|uniref:Protein LTV1 homolog n=1 Tax=Mizuhopecten yessoensis TaxID=6573 RepID=A0A210QBW0_MIZYE|nr:protein LTV1 homolog [Mizuhopecten yessoensis]OWF46212.1 Protein LTV1-like [Mizuhopecten yessoensis]
MPGKKKPFIDKKNAVTFHLVHRSQKDPLQASEEASKHVLLQAVTKKDFEEKKEEEQKYGVFYDDEYDYMQHLRETNEACELEAVDVNRIPSRQEQQAAKIQLPSTAFASDIETGVGLLNKAAPSTGPKLDWDPEIVAALDDDFKFDDPNNQLDDDFMELANAEGTFADGKELDSDECDVDSNDAAMSDDEMGGYPGDQMFMDEETKSRFTSYSMSSSVIRRNDGLTLLDDRFEKFYEQFDDTEIGPLDHEDIEGAVDQNSYMLNTILEEFEKQQDPKKLKDVVDENIGEEVDGKNDESEDDDDMVDVEVQEPGEKWDCESILSTYSNIYNHPKLIEEPRKERKINLTSRLGIPNESLKKSGLTQKQIEKSERDARLADKASTYRPKDETQREKKERKQAVKEERKERRQEKKANKKAFTEEKIRLEKELKNLKNNLQGVKIV